MFYVCFKNQSKNVIKIILRYILFSNLNDRENLEEAVFSLSQCTVIFFCACRIRLDHRRTPLRTVHSNAIMYRRFQIRNSTTQYGPVHPE